MIEVIQMTIEHIDDVMVVENLIDLLNKLSIDNKN